MDRLRDWVSLPEHGQDHADIERRLDEQEVALLRLEAYAEVKGRKGLERRHVLTPKHPKRRSGDA